MQSLALPPGPLTLLCLGAHADDGEIGAAGTVRRLLEEHPGSTIRWVVFSGIPARQAEAAASAARLLERAAVATVETHQHRDGHFPVERSELKERFEHLKRELAPGPDLILTHYREDRHQDHRTLSELTWETFRSHLVLEYEIPKYDGDLGAPNLFVPMTGEQARWKLDHLMGAFPSQHDKAAFRTEHFSALLRLRGLECAAPEGWAEAFYLRKARLGRA